MAKKTLVIEIGERITKVSVVSKRGSGYHSSRDFQFQTPDNCLSDGAITSTDILGAAINEQLLSNRIMDAKEVVFVISSTKIVSREVTLPPVKANRIGEIIATNARDYFPIDLNGYQITHSLLEVIKGNEPGNRVLVTVAPKNIMLSYQRLNAILGLNLIGFEHVANGQYQLFSSVSMDGNTLFLDISTNYTISTFMSNGLMLMQRTMPFGGEELITTAMNNAGMQSSEFSAAMEKAKDSSWISTNLPQNEYSTVASRLLSIIVRNNDFFKSAYKGEVIDRVVLLGSCSKVAGITSVISSGLALEVSTIDSVPAFRKILDSSDTSVYASTLSALINPLDLIPQEMLQTRQREVASKGASMVFPVMLLVVAVFAGGAFSAFSYLENLEAKAELKATQDRIVELQPVVITYNKYVDMLILENNINVLESEGINNNNANLRLFFEELELKMPSSLLMLSAVCDNAGVSMNIEVASKDDAAVVVSELRTFNSIAQLMISPLVEEENDLGVDIISFSVSCVYTPTDVAVSEIPAPIAIGEE